MPAEPRHGAVLLLAGGSRRLGTPKQLLTFDGETLAHRAARFALATEPAETVAVLGARAEEVRAALAGLDLRFVTCAEWERGMGRSLREGLAALSPASEGALVVLCDQPALTPGHLAALVAAWRRDPERAAASGYAGTVGVPALLPRPWFAALEGDGDRGARELLRGRREEVSVVPDDSLAHDVDLPDGLVSER
jgi:CTP:molybdopterin cytidylyltransferase MocA